MNPQPELTPNKTPKKVTTWKIAGSVLAFLSVLFLLVAVTTLGKPSRQPDNDAYNAGRVVGALLIPAIAGIGAYVCFRKARQ